MQTELDLAREALRRVEQRPGALIYDPDAAKLARRLGFVPDFWQQEFLTATEQSILLNCSRQSGKSTCTALLALFEALTIPRSLILLLSPSLRQSGELIRKVYDFYAALGGLIGWYPSERETILTLELVNGSRIVSLPGKDGTVRGYSGARLIIIDEAARTADDLYYAIRPMLAISGGRLILLSTPFGKRGFFFEAWDKGGADWRRFEIPAPQCPRISAEFLDQERRNMGEYFYLQEYFSVFMDAQTAAFGYEDVMAARNEDVEIWTY